MADRLEMPRSTSPGFRANLSAPSNSDGSIAVEPPSNGTEHVTFDEIDKLKRELALSKDSASIRVAELEPENAALLLEVFGRREVERLASAQSETIARTLDTRTTNSSIDIVATDVSLAIADHLGAKDAALWTHDEQFWRLTLHLRFEEGHLPAPGDVGHPGWDSHADDENAYIERLKVGREAFVGTAGFIDTEASMTRCSLGIKQERVGATLTLITEPNNGTKVNAVCTLKPEISDKHD